LYATESRSQSEARLLSPLERTFLHIQGIGLATELKLWNSGIVSWYDLVERASEIPATGMRSLLLAACRESIEKLAVGDANYFLERLPSNEVWRAFCSFPGAVAYLDIETTSAAIDQTGLTVVGLFDGQSVHSFIADFEDLTERPPLSAVRYRTLLRPMHDLGDALSNFPRIVTYNGAVFDLPIIRRHFPDASFGRLHLDLRVALRGYGIKGGLKAIEKSFGISRPESVQGLNGFDAVRLWMRYRYFGDVAALATLIVYNAEDIINLQTLLRSFLDQRTADFPSGTNFQA